MNRDYADLLPRVVAALYSDPEERADVVRRLSAYGTEDFHREVDRVRLGILRLASREPDRLDAFVRLATIDYRDLLCAAEFPLTSAQWGLHEQDPERHAALAAKEREEYDDWLAEILG